jgi:hypothetical protein
MRGICVLITLLFIYPSIAQNSGDHVDLSSIGAYRSTFDKVSYNTSSDMKMGSIGYSDGMQFYSSEVSSRKVEQMAYFNLNKNYNHLTGQVGIDDKTNVQKGKVTFTFAGDDRELQTITMYPADLPVSVDLDVSGVRRLTLDVTSESSDGVYRDVFIDLVNMILWKQPQM